MDASILPSASSSSSSGASEDSFEDSCSICLEPFTTEDPATVTNCKHEYHLQCIVEWSQRSKECPICWQILSLKDPTSQELLAVVESERCSISRHATVAYEDFQEEHDAPYVDFSEFNEHIMQHLAAATSRRPRSLSKRERQGSSVFDASQGLVFSPLPNAPEVLTPSSLENQNSSYVSSEVDSLRSRTPIFPNSPQDVISSVTMVSGVDVNRESPPKPRILFTRPPLDGSQMPRTSELHSISDTIKSKFSAASSRYKDSISKGTRGLKEKLMARNASVKELSKGVQREVNAGIAGVARMIERMDPISKRTDVPVPLPGSDRSTSHFFSKGKGVQDNGILQSLDKDSGDVVHDLTVDGTFRASAAIPIPQEVSHTQSEP